MAYGVYPCIEVDHSVQLRLFAPWHSIRYVPIRANVAFRPLATRKLKLTSAHFLEVEHEVEAGPGPWGMLFGHTG
jgi:hypothetical protein